MLLAPAASRWCRGGVEVCRHRRSGPTWPWRPRWSRGTA